MNDIWIADILKLSKRNEMYERLEESIMAITGRLTLPTDVDVIDETIRLKNLLGADALRDCDGTEMPEALLYRFSTRHRKSTATFPRKFSREFPKVLTFRCPRFTAS